MVIIATQDRAERIAAVQRGLHDVGLKRGFGPNDGEGPCTIATARRDNLFELVVWDAQRVLHDPYGSLVRVEELSPGRCPEGVIDRNVEHPLRVVRQKVRWKA